MEKKKVTNLLCNISKLRDLLEEKDKNKILNNLYLFARVENDVRIQIQKYIRYPEHELDFNYQDLQELGNEIFEFIKNYQQKFLFSKYQKELMQKAPITDDIFNEITQQISKDMLLDTKLREVYKSIGYYAMVIFLWKENDEKKPFDVQITELIRSFI